MVRPTGLGSPWWQVGPKLAGRPIDIVVFGATGLTGGYLLEYLNDAHPNLTIALGGRNLKRLEEVREKRGKPGQPLIVANSGDLDSLVAMCVGYSPRFNSRPIGIHLQDHVWVMCIKSCRFQVMCARLPLATA